jgi:hypothetical protein
METPEPVDPRLTGGLRITDPPLLLRVIRRVPDVVLSTYALLACPLMSISATLTLARGCSPRQLRPGIA